VRNPADAPGAGRYVVLLEWAGDQIALIRDFKFAPHVRVSLVISNPGDVAQVIDLGNVNWRVRADR
jgi:hypothetical protein